MMDATLEDVTKETRREPTAEEKVAEELVRPGSGIGHPHQGILALCARLRWRPRCGQDTFPDGNAMSQAVTR
jgi:hypothetical protein